MPVTLPLVHPLTGHDLAALGARTALVTEAGDLSYADLADRAGRAARRLGDGRRLVLLTGGTHVDTVAVYLGALAAGHPVLLSPDGAVDALTERYDPDVVVRTTAGGAEVTERRPGSRHRLHPDLALLMSTSGSTGSPKLVRLSYRNLHANAASIATYLDIRETDRAATTLPLHYCYGLSVLNSHLLRGAGLVLTGRSVTDGAFWELFRRAGGTMLAGVPHTFALLDRVGFDAMRLPHLRHVTQAGGRLAPERVRHYAALGRRRGWDFVVMYGQTEATARMAYLPPQRALDNPAAIGVPVPGGALRLVPAEEADSPDVGELVYTGPNVMLGYAGSPADLARGRTVHELRTGDLARRTPDGLYELVGRRSRFVKVFGLRVDLPRVEAQLQADGVTACCAPGDDRLVVAVEQPGDHRRAAAAVAARCGLPVHAVHAVPVPELPRLPSGKVDVAAVARLPELAGPAGAGAPGAAGTAPAAGPAPGADAGRSGGTPGGTAEGTADRDPDGDGDADLCRVYAEVLGLPQVSGDDTFVGLGGDSLSYVEVSVRLERILGPLPPDWHTTPVRSLRGPDRPRPRATRRRTVDTSVALRAVAVVLIVGTHVEAFTVRGGAHLLLAVAGFNFARFHLTGGPRRDRVRRLAASTARIAVPTCLFLALVVPFDDRYGWPNVLLLNEAVGPRTGTRRYFWFVENLVYTLLFLLAVLAVPRADRAERRWPFLLPVALLGGGLTARYGLLPVTVWDNMATPVLLFWFFALGWAAGKAQRVAHRVLLTAVAAVALPGYFGNPGREAVVAVGAALLIWVPRLPSTAWVNRVAGALAGASLYVYLTHWQVYPLLQEHSRWAAVAAALAAGVAFGAVVNRVARRLPGLWRRARGRVRRDGPAAGREAVAAPAVAPQG